MDIVQGVAEVNLPSVALFFRNQLHHHLGLIVHVARRFHVHLLHYFSNRARQARHLTQNWLIDSYPLRDLRNDLHLVKGFRQIIIEMSASLLCNLTHHAHRGYF